MNYKLIFCLIIFFKFSNCLSSYRTSKKDTISESIFWYRAKDCFGQEIEYFNRIIKKDGLYFIGSFDYLGLYELPTLIENPNGDILIATLILNNGYVWDYTFIKFYDNKNIDGFRQRKGRPLVEELVDIKFNYKIFEWLKTIFLHSSKILQKYNQENCTIL